MSISARFATIKKAGQAKPQGRTVKAKPTAAKAANANAGVKARGKQRLITQKSARADKLNQKRGIVAAAPTKKGKGKVAIKKVQTTAKSATRKTRGAKTTETAASAKKKTKAAAKAKNAAVAGAKGTPAKGKGKKAAAKKPKAEKVPPASAMELDQDMDSYWQAKAAADSNAAPDAAAV